ncbi:MAG: hypothetical protein NVSMB9_01030 [Isosphaeraceae bacterium]
MRGRCIAMTVLVASATSCANVHVKKVSLDKRIENKDNHVHGFRYYVSRPYVVVDMAIPVATTQWMARLVRVTPKRVGVVKPPWWDDKKEEMFMLQGLAPEVGNEHFLYDLAGTPVGVLAKADYDIIVVKEEQQPTKSAQEKDQTPKAEPTTKSGQEKDPPTNATPQPATTTPTPPSSAPVLRPPGAGPGTSQAPKLDPSRLMADVQALHDAQLKQARVGGTQTIPVKTTPLSNVTGAASDMVSTSVLLGAKDAPVSDNDHIQVAFLPDFEEQLAIHHTNFAAYNKYELHFNDGWALDGYSGNFNATQVPVAILQTIQHILGVAADYQAAVLKANPSGGKSMGAADVMATGRVPNNEVLFYLQKRLQIEPGVYRVQKSWERVAVPDRAIAPTVASGLLSDLGIPVVETTQVTRVSQQQ